MQVSVIIPVYNAASFVREAVQSALDQPETAEVILVEDGSPDDSLEVCKQIAHDFPDYVQLFTHPGNVNLGAAASRELGIGKARFSYVAFLDADDYYLPGRFVCAHKIFAARPEVEGVYEAITGTIESDDALKRLQSLHMVHLLRITVTEPLEGRDLFYAVITRNVGFANILGLTLKREIFKRISPLDAHLKLHQDSAMILKIMATAYLVPGSLDEPVAVYRFHENNNYTARRSKAETLHHFKAYLDTLVEWGKHNLSQKDAELLNDYRHVQYAYRAVQLRDDGTPRHPGNWLNMLSWRWALLRVIVQHPDMLRQSYIWGQLLPAKLRTFVR